MDDTISLTCFYTVDFWKTMENMGNKELVFTKSVVFILSKLVLPLVISLCPLCVSRSMTFPRKANVSPKKSKTSQIALALTNVNFLITVCWRFCRYVHTQLFCRYLMISTYLLIFPNKLSFFDMLVNPAKKSSSLGVNQPRKCQPKWPHKIASQICSIILGAFGLAI